MDEVRKEKLKLMALRLSIKRYQKIVDGRIRMFSVEDVIEEEEGFRRLIKIEPNIGNSVTEGEIPTYLCTCCTVSLYIRRYYSSLGPPLFHCHCFLADAINKNILHGYGICLESYNREDFSRVLKDLRAVHSWKLGLLN